MIVVQIEILVYMGRSQDLMICILSFYVSYLADMVWVLSTMVNDCRKVLQDRTSEFWSLDTLKTTDDAQWLRNNPPCWYQLIPSGRPSSVSWSAKISSMLRRLFEDRPTSAEGSVGRFRTEIVGVDVSWPGWSAMKSSMEGFRSEIVRVDVLARMINNGAFNALSGGQGSSAETPYHQPVPWLATLSWV